MFAKLGHMQKAAHVFAIAPDGEGYSPLFQTRTKVFGPVDRVDDCDPALKRRRGLGLECLFPDDPHAWQYALEEEGHFTFQKQIRIRHGASVRLPNNLVTERQKGRHQAFRQVDGVREEISDRHGELFRSRRCRPVRISYWLSR